MLDLAYLSQAWKLSPVLASWTPETGTIHQTLLLKTAQAGYALRKYRYRKEERWRIECEHKIVAYVHERGLPAIAPLPLSNGATILEQESTFYALFPFAQGHQVPRRELASGEIVAMGEFLGQMQRVLRDYPSEHVPARIFAVDGEETLAKIAEIEAALLSRNALDEFDRQALKRLNQRRAWLLSSPPAEETSFSQLERQVIHGDYQEANLFFENGRVSAIIDWDQTFAAPRAWEVVRAFHYMFKFEGEACRTFLEAYRRVMPLTHEELEIVASVYCWLRTHDVWLYEELYLRNNQRVRAFLQPGNFVPLAERWARLSTTLR